MSKFNAEVYDKLFPRPVETVRVESAVSTFTPTTDLAEGIDIVETPVEEVVEGGVEDGNGTGDNGSDN